MLATYQSSGVHTCKWHALELLSNSVKEVEYTALLHVELYESTNKMFKLLYCPTLKRKNIAMKEAAKKIKNAGMIFEMWAL